jgi:hypothetical protein
MKKIIYLFIICFICMQAQQVYAAVTSYYFDQFVCGNTYTPITGGVTYLINGNDDWIHANINLGFNFTFNGVTYSTCNISTNGFITFGTTAPTFNNYVPLASTETYAGCISAVGMNIRQQGTGELRSMTQGSAPNRTFTVQYKDFGPTSSSELYNFQIVLYETSGRIDINYGSFTVSATRNPQVGLRGAASADYAARWMLVGQTWLTSSAASCNCATEISTSRFPMTNLQYRWMPSAPMTYVSSTVTQTNFADVLRGTTNVQMIGIEIRMTGEQSAMSLTSVSFNTTGTTNPSTDISNAKLWSTSGNCSYAVTSQQGSTIASPNGVFIINGFSLALTPGPNYLWLSYDVNSGATPDNFIDAVCSSVTINGTPFTPSVTSPAGSRKIVGPMSGTLHIGTGKDFTTISSAVSNLNIRGVSAPITFVLDDAVYSSETFPITIGSIPGASSTNTVKFMLNALLANNSVAPVISGSSSAMLIDLNGADYVTFDGRPGGTGTTKGLTLRNTSTAVTASTIRLINDAQNNTITYCIVEGSSANTTGTGGNIYFATPTSTGNDNNTISFCDIRDRSDASAAPNYGIVSTGSGSFGPDNSGNIITDNNIYNFYLHGGNSAGVLLAGGNTQWTITNNHFYQTAIRTTTVSTTTNGINITSGSASFGHTITGNFIGGSAPNAGGTPWTVTTSTTGAGNTINGIRVNPTSGSLASSIQNNTIKNFSLTTIPSVTGNVWFTGINVNGGANIGNVTPNIIGSATGNGAISITFGNTTVITTHVRGIDMSSASSFSGSIANNVIGSFTITGTSSGLMTFTGINAGGIPSSAFSISGNTIGSTTTAGSIQTTSTTMPALLNGISSGFTTSTNSITNNNIVNFINASTASNGQLTGITYSGSVATSITGNTIRDLSSATSGTGTTASANNIVGILSTSANTGQVISTNQIYSLRSTNTGAFNMIVTGIGMNNVSSSGTISRNRIYDLTNTATGSAPAIYGIFTNTPGWNLTNNQVTLTNGEALDNFTAKEISENGDASTNNVIIRGIYDNSTSGTSNIYYNSVYIGGSISSGSNNSYCYYRDGTATLNLKNNLFYNRRTGGTGSHYAIGNTNAAGFSSASSNYNVFISPGSSRVGEWVGGLARTISEWRTSTSGDAQSWSTTSGTLSAANLFTSISTGNLLIQSGNAEAWIVSGKGTVITGQNIDYDGTARQVAVSGGVTDIGSDEFASVPPSSPSATESAPPIAGTTTTYTLYGRTICSITWGTIGTFPSGMSVKYNSGVLPSNIGSGRSSYSHWTVSPSSGSLNGKYCITFNFGDNETYNISSPSTNTILAKKDATVWEVYPLYSSGNTNWKSQLNWSAKTIRVDSLHSFSDFALTDGTLALPVSISLFNASVNSRDINLSWVTESELNNNGFEIERKIISDNSSSAEWQKVSFIQGSGTSNTQHSYTYTDKKLPAGKYKYRLKQIDYNGGHEYFELSDAMIISAPKSFDVTQNYPNPSNPNSKIDFELPADMKVNIKVYDITGKEIALLLNEFKNAGYYTVDFNGSNIASGVYFYRITAEGSAQKFSKTMKMVLIK